MALTDLPRDFDPVTKKLAPERFADATEVAWACRNLIDGDKARGVDRSKVQGLIDGNVPIKPEILKQYGRSWESNANFRGAKGFIAAQAAQLYDLTFEAEPCIEVELEFGSGEQQAEWQRIIAAEFHRMVFYKHEADPWSWGWHTQRRDSEMLTHGVAFHLHMHSLNWQPQTMGLGQVLMPDGTMSDFSNMDYLVIRDSLKPHQLYRKVKDKDTAKAMGWDCDACIDAIMRSRSNGQSLTAQEAQSVFKNNDIGYSVKCRDIRTNTLLVEEMDGGITQYIIEDAVGPGADPKFLFKKRNRFKSWSDIVTAFPLDIGSEGTMHSIRGLGHVVFPFFELDNRLKNAMVNNVLVGSGLLLKNTSGTEEEIKLMKISSVATLLPQGVDVAGQQLTGLNSDQIALSRELQNSMVESTKTYRQSVSGQDRIERTASEVLLNAQEQSQQKKSLYNIHYGNLEQEYTLMFRRAINPRLTDSDPGGKAAKRFLARCIEKGVPPEAFSKVATIRAVKATGNGSVAARLAIMETMLKMIYPLTTDDRKVNILRDFTAALTHSGMVDRYAPSLNSDEMIRLDDAMAQLENNDLVEGKVALVATEQNHKRHLTQHTKAAFEYGQAIIEGQVPPQEGVVGLKAFLTHSYQHLQGLSTDPTEKAAAKEFEEQLAELGRFTDKVAQNAEEAAGAEQPQQQGPDPEIMAKMAKTEADIQMADRKVSADIARKDAKAASDIRLGELRAKSDMIDKRELKKEVLAPAG